MAATKVTFTLDQATIGRLQDAAERLRIPKSEVVRQAIGEFHERLGLSERERHRLRMLRASALSFGPRKAALSAKRYRPVQRPRDDLANRGQRHSSATSTIFRN